VFGSLLFFFSLCAWVRSTGQSLPPILIVGLVPPEQICLFGILFGAPMLYIVTFYAFRFLTKARSPKISKRIPPVFNPDDGPFARWIGLFGYVVFPCFAQIHFLDSFLESGYYNRHDPSDHIQGGFASVLSTFRPPSVLFQGDIYRYHSVDGVQVFPFWQPWFFLFLVVGALVYVSLYFIRLVRPHSRSGTSGSGRARNFPKFKSRK
jgi:hypothetical protein